MSGSDLPSLFQDDYRHFVLRPKGFPKPPRKIPQGKKPRIFPHRSTTGYEVLRSQAARILAASPAKQAVYADSRIYFKVTFSDKISWRSIDTILRGMNAYVVKMIDDVTVKLAVDRNRYPNFLGALHEGRHFIEKIAETTLEEIAGQSLYQQVTSEPDAAFHVTIELDDKSGLTNLVELESSVNRYLQQGNLGEIQRSYFAKTLAVYDAKIKGRAVSVLAQSLGMVERIELTPAVEVSEVEQHAVEVLPDVSVIAATSATNTPTPLPSVCTIDTGVNQTHPLLVGNIRDTFDYFTQSQYPCTDTDGHGSMVAGLIMYGNQVITSRPRPVCQAIMVKGFTNSRSQYTDLLLLISRAVALYFPTARVFNLSFGTDGPVESWTRALEDLVYSNGVIVVACAGNIRRQELESHASNGDVYPNYLYQHAIYFPGDTQNAITVGSYSSAGSNWVNPNCPSPFTKPGANPTTIKPDLLENGGNLGYSISSGAVTLSCTGIGISSAGPLGNVIREDVGTSFSAPKVASLAAVISSKYNENSPFLIKALLLASCAPLRNGTFAFDPLIQGYGAPREFDAISSSSSRVTYLAKGEFTGLQEEYHSLSFLFPDDASLLRVTFVLGRPLDSNGYVTLRLKRPGAKLKSKAKPTASLGSEGIFRRIHTTYQETHEVKKGGKGVWLLQISPHFDKTIDKDRSLKYGCVITVESTRGRNIYSRIQRWVGSTTEAARGVETLVSLEGVSTKSRVRRNSSR